MATTKMLRGRMMRATLVSGCGEPVLSPDSTVATSGFVSIALTANNDEGTAIQLANANGDMCIDDTPVPKFRSWSGTATFCGVDPELFHLMTGQPLVLNPDDEPVGIKTNSAVDMEAVAFALEVWAGVHTNVCDESGETSYGYILLPFAKGGAIGDITIENGAVTFTVAGFTTRDGTGWGVGPYDVLMDETSNPGPLWDALDANDHLYLVPTTVAPPEETDGAVALGTAATGAVAGTPGNFTPANSYGPANLADLIAGDSGPHGVDVVASPATAWTAGQSVILRDGTRAHWTSSAWAAGPA